MKRNCVLLIVWDLNFSPLQVQTFKGKVFKEKVVLEYRFLKWNGTKSNTIKGGKYNLKIICRTHEMEFLAKVLGNLLSHKKSNLLVYSKS